MLEEDRKAALARLRSPMGYVSASIPDKLVCQGEEVFLHDILDKVAAGEIREAEVTRTISLLRSFVKEVEEKISEAAEEELGPLLKDGLGARRALKRLGSNRREEHVHERIVDDAKRWIGFSKDIKG
ncbi:MAG: hypothetical protein KAT70_08480 [Thermoplasmata archaeon]|nr:hypothetical protein [Thermoplasmata archaeon]